MLLQMGHDAVRRSGVWLASVSQWGRNQRAFLEAGAAGRPGPTVPAPVGLEPRVQRGSATTLNQSLAVSTALEKENAIACATFTPVAQMHQHFGRCNAVSLTLCPTRMNSTAGFQFLIQHTLVSSTADPLMASFPRKCWTLSLMVPLALKAATAEMSVLMAYVRYWVCFLNIQLHKIMILLIQEVTCSNLSL